MREDGNVGQVGGTGIRQKVVKGQVRGSKGSGGRYIVKGTVSRW